VGIVRGLQAFAVDLSVSLLNLMTCVDPAAIDAIRALSPKAYAESLKTWPPLTNAIAAAARDPAILAAVASVKGGALTGFQAAMEDVMSQVTATTIAAFQASLAGNPSPVAATAAATAAAKAAASGLVPQVAARVAADPALSGLVSTVPGAIVAAMAAQLPNLTRPEIVATLPILGPTLACLASQLSSPAVAGVIQSGIKYARSQTLPRVGLIDVASVDPCRDSLEVYGCADRWRAAYPPVTAQRQDLFQRSQAGDGLDALYGGLNRSAVAYDQAAGGGFCDEYESHGCSAVLSVLVKYRSVSGWGQFVNRTREVIDSYVVPFNDTINYVSYYAEERVLPCFLTGHVLAFVSSVVITCNVLWQVVSVMLRHGRKMT
jgi:hypothetical protein